MSTLTREDIREALSTASDNRLILRPLLDPEIQIKGCGVDLRLGNQFIVFHQRSLTHVDAASSKFKADIRKYQTRVVIPYTSDSGFILHPGQFVLGATIEYVAMPEHLEGQVEGRSSWARVGLTVVSASTVAPGFKGVITLELANHGVAPLTLWPGVRIATLVLHRVTKKAKYKGKKYTCPIGPEFSKLYEDVDLRPWR